jgi:hypothetical protein
LDVMQKAVRRHKVKFMESLEDDPQDFVSELLIPDILFSFTGTFLKYLYIFYYFLLFFLELIRIENTYSSKLEFK